MLDIEKLHQPFLPVSKDETKNRQHQVTHKKEPWLEL